VKRGTIVTAPVKVRLRQGYHVNSNTPSDDYLIPLRLNWKADPLQPLSILYPKPHMEKYTFSAKPLSVYSGGFEIQTRFRVPAKAPNGPAILDGKLRYQACNDRLCLPPKTIDVPLTVEIE
jgi:Thiol:disulfide interchange protein DsbD, N-terminal